jgi:CheY-like chemotaxis protein
MEQKFKYHSIMLIDDDEMDNFINERIIGASNITEHIYTHNGARSAIEFLKNMEKISPGTTEAFPDIIFLDIDMPLMDGFAFLDEFDKMKEETKKHCKIIMLTSSINPYDINKSKKYDYVKKYIRKPLSEDNIKNLLF